MKKFRPSRRAAIAMRAELNRYRKGQKAAPVTLAKSAAK